MLYGGAVTALVAILVGLPALRMPGLFLAVTTLAFAIFMQSAVLATPCFSVPGIHKTLCTGLPDPGYTFLGRPSLFGLSLASQKSFALFSLGVLLLSVFMVRIWRDKGVARRLVAVRDNELTAAAMGIPILRTKLLAFGLSGFMAGYAGVCFAFATQQLNNTDITFDPTTSFVIISMVVIGGLGSIPGAILGRHLPRGPSRALRRQPDDPVHHQRPGPDPLHPLPAGRAGRAAAPHRRRRHPGHPHRPGAAELAAGRARRSRRPGHRRGRAVTAVAEAPAAVHPARLTVEGVRVQFGGVHALNGVTFEAEPGSIVGLIGANGSGKTTTLDVISGLVAPQSGPRAAGRRRPGRVPARGTAGRRHGALVPGLPAVPGADRARRPAPQRGRPPGSGGALHHAAPAVGAPDRAPQARRRWTG